MINQFKTTLDSHRLSLKKTAIDILQVNCGRLCNLTCSHCHVQAGPAHTRENMDAVIADHVVQFMERYPVGTLDLTGGAPEMNPFFKKLVEAASLQNIRVIDRCNLTILLEASYAHLIPFFVKHRVEVVASLPCYLQDNVDKQRGKGVFQDSVEALKKLNKAGFGCEDSGLLLNLVYNPVGPHLPPVAQSLEHDYRNRLREDHGIEFNRLYTITNMPITRYAMFLRAVGKYEDYRQLLIDHFNPGTVEGLMCKNTLNVGWDGKVYDCDFHQAMHLPMGNESPLYLKDFLKEEAGAETLFNGADVLTADHCFGCTAGAGSSCQGAIV